jgi:hypothetical protein|tara:strand:+ start:4122 stop:4307 length:186 start_codon:yes stop_codon:yes gene_type:complete
MSGFNIDISRILRYAINKNPVGCYFTYKLQKSVVIKTDGWSFDSLDEIQELIDRAEKVLKK